MRNFTIILLMLSCLSCHEKRSGLAVELIIDKAIEVSGGALYASSEVSFFFRDKKYVSTIDNGKKVLKRITFTDSIEITDVKTLSRFQRYYNDSLIDITDSIASRYSNSVNSVHYFVRLPFGLNDAAVKKELLGDAYIKGQEYFKVKVTFQQENGGEDFDDIYIYWFNKNTFKADYLAYEFHVDGGGMRFREALNERYVNGIRFVDYDNYKPKNVIKSIYDIDSLYLSDGLDLLSKIELKEITVAPLN